MKLSEAIRLGAMMGPQVFHGGLDGEARCAIKAAALAVGVPRCTTSQAAALFPWTQNTPIRCPDCGQAETDVAYVIAQHLNDEHRWTRERIADWVATIEPEEVHASETIREVQYGLGPMRSTPEVETFETITK